MSTQTDSRPTALIAEDELHLAHDLKKELARAWPDLEVISIVGDGLSAVKETLRLKPDIIFFDIHMPGMSGLEAAAELADAWTDCIFPLLVFITSHDQYALQAFEAQAVDYILKPINLDRLLKTVVKLRLTGLNRFHTAIYNAENFNVTLKQIRHLLNNASAQMGTTTQIKVIKVNLPPPFNAIKMLPIEDVIYFSASDKYVQVVTATRSEEAWSDYLIRTPLKDLIPQLNPFEFWQIHRGIIVRASAIDTVNRDINGKLSLTLHGRSNRIPVSRLYAHLFKSK
jgi:DNA-binding LytR/AlgR family response regulator